MIDTRGQEKTSAFHEFKIGFEAGSFCHFFSGFLPPLDIGRAENKWMCKRKLHVLGDRREAKQLPKIVEIGIPNQSESLPGSLRCPLSM
jgi:hypothetical protein